jgi:hypothetical protein
VASDVAEHALSNIDLSAACEQTACQRMRRLTEARQAEITVLNHRIAQQAAEITRMESWIATQAKELTRMSHSSLALAASRRRALDQALGYMQDTVGNVWKRKGKTHMTEIVNTLLESEPTWQQLRTDVGAILNIPAEDELKSTDVLTLAVGLVRNEADASDAGASASNENSAASNSFKRR